MSAEDFIRTGSKIIGKSYDYNWPDYKKGMPLPEPLLFIKPTSSYTGDGQVIEVPRGCEVYHEVEIAVVIGKTGRAISVDDAMEYVAGYALVLDMTAKNVQAAAAKQGYPWAICKGLDTFTPIGKFIPKSEIPDPHDVHLEFKVTGETRQSGSTSGLIYSVAQLIAYASGAFTLRPGDTILTGTPKGVGRVYQGEQVSARMSRSDGSVLDSLELDVVSRDQGFRFDGKHWLTP